MAAVPGFVAPYIVGAITNNNVSRRTKKTIEETFKIRRNSSFSKLFTLGKRFLIFQLGLASLVVLFIVFFSMEMNKRGIVLDLKNSTKKKMIVKLRGFFFLFFLINFLMKKVQIDRESHKKSPS